MTSEEALTTLERSKEDPIDLLDHVESIAKVKFDQGKGHHVKTSRDRSSDGSSDFREQWLLKWMLKKIKEASEPALRLELNGSKSSENLLESSTYWSLLLYLLEAIHDQALLEILLERGFVSLLLACTQNIFLKMETFVESSSNNDTISFPIGTSAEPPQKKRRISRSTDDISRTPYSEDLQTRTRLLLSVSRCFADLLLRQSKSIEGVSRTVTPAWATSAEEAASFVGFIVNLANKLLKVDTATQLQPIYNTVEKWLAIWHGFVSATNKKDKQIMHKQFNQSCLNSLLDLSKSLESQLDDTASKSVQSAIKHEIALHTIIPLRTEFNDKFSAIWKTQELISWTDIQPTYQILVDYLGSALATKSIHGSEFISLAHPDHACQLLSIACQLIPKDDLRRRQWETSWLEALSLSLCHLAYPEELPKLMKNEQGHLIEQTEMLPLKLDVDEGMACLIDFLDTIYEQHINLSTPVARYLITTVLSRRGSNPSLEMLSKLVRLDVDCFVPQPGDTIGRDANGKVVTAIQERQPLNSSEHLMVVDRIVLPLMQGFAKSRNLSGFVNMWLGLLEDAFQNRRQASDHQSTFVWDDEGVFSEFESLCRTHALQDFEKELFTDVISQLKEMADKIGSTADTFAKIAVLNSVIRARNFDIMSLCNTVDILNIFVNAVMSSLKQNTDYQGQRWRLWSSLHSVLRSQPALAKTIDFAANLPKNLPYRDFASQLEVLTEEQVSLFERSNYLMECFQSFTFVLELACFPSPYASQHLHDLVEHVIKLIGFLEAEPEGLSAVLDSMWDGSLITLREHADLLCGYLASLYQKFESLPATILSPLVHCLRVPVYQFAKGADPALQQLSCGYIAQQLLMRADEANGHSLLSAYLEQLVKDPDSRVPVILHMLPTGHKDKAWAAEMAKGLFETVVELFENQKRMTDDNVVAQLCLLTQLVVAFPVSVGHPKHFDELAKLVRVVQHPQDTKNSTAIRHCIHQIFIACYDRSLGGTKTSAPSLWLKTLHDSFLSPLEQELTSLAKSIVSGRSIALEFSQQDPSSLPTGLSIPDVHTILADMAQYEGNDKSARTLQQTLIIASSYARRLDEQQKFKVLGLLGSMHIKDITCHRLMLSTAIISTISNDELSPASGAYKTIASATALDGVLESLSSLELLLRCDQSNLMLNRFPSIVKQATIDSLLGRISLLASSAGPQLDTSDYDNVTSTAIYDRLLMLLTTLLTRYRRRLNGRSHLLLPVLQNLLKCLCYTSGRTYIHQNPATVKQKQTFRDSLPSWLKLSGGRPLPPASAEKFSRILSSICNPTTASARSAHRSRQQAAHIKTLELNDETQKARRIAAQYMQYFLIEYARCTLDGVMLPEVRDKLIPGLYSVLDSLDKSLMRAMNAAMDPSSRAIFKGLYDDWIRYGKWNQS